MIRLVDLETWWAGVRPSESGQETESTVRRRFRSGYGFDGNVRRGAFSVTPQYGPSRTGSRRLVGLRQPFRSSYCESTPNWKSRIRLEFRLAWSRPVTRTHTDTHNHPLTFSPVETIGIVFTFHDPSLSLSLALRATKYSSGTNFCSPSPREIRNREDYAANDYYY